MSEVNTMPDGIAKFEFADGMPCKPDHNSLENSNLEKHFKSGPMTDLVARLLSYSKDSGKWVGVAWPVILQSLKEEHDQNDKIHEAFKQNRDNLNSAASNYRRELRVYKKWMHRTLGIYGLFKAKPAEEIVIEKTVPVKTSRGFPLYRVSPDTLAEAANKLDEKGLLKISDGVYAGTDTDYIFPTVKLIDFILSTKMPI